MEKYPKLIAKDRKAAFHVRNMIQNKSFWMEIASVIVVFELMVKVLRMVDSNDKAEMGYLYEDMDRAKEAIRRNAGKGYRKWWEIIDRQWEKRLHRNIHAAGYFLNPTIQYSKNATNDDEVLSGFRHIASRLESDICKQLDIDGEVEFYRMKVGDFGTEKNRIAEFHMELELLPATALENPCIKYAVKLEQSFMEGAYNAVLSARKTVPHEIYVYFMDLLAKTVRDEMAGCSEKAYDYLLISVAKKKLMFSSDQELSQYITEEHPEWEIKNGCVFCHKAKESQPCKEIPSLQLINQTLSYAKGLERIV